MFIYRIVIAALISLFLSIGLLFSGLPKAEFYGLYVAVWVPSILSFGSLWLLSKQAMDKE